MLRILEEKGHVRHEQDGPRYVYLPTVARDNAKRSALQHMLHTFFDGSAEQAISALLDDASANLSEASSIVSRADRSGPSHREHKPCTFTIVLVRSPVAAWLPLRRRDHEGHAALRRRGCRVDVRCARASAAARHLVWTLALSARWRFRCSRWRCRAGSCRSSVDASRRRRRLPAASGSDRLSARTCQLRRSSDASRFGRRSCRFAASPAVTRPAAPGAAPSWNRTCSLAPTSAGWLVAHLGGRVRSRSSAAWSPGILAVQWLSRRTEQVIDAPWLPLRD